MKEKVKLFLTDRRTLLWIWMIVAVTGMTRFGHGRENNFLIYKQVYWHVVDQLPLFTPYPSEYFDLNHYGPFFSLVIAPFAVMPTWIGMLFWLIVLTLCLYVSIRHNLFTKYQQIFIYWFCIHELLNGVQMQQFNIAIAAIVVASYYLISKEKDLWAAFLIMLGTFVKFYGIVGLAFFFFSKHKVRFIGSLVLWAVVMFVAPMVLSSPEYVLSQYNDWYFSLVEKNNENLFSLGQNISLLGIVRKVSGCAAYSDLWLIVPGLVAFALPYLRLKQYANEAFRQTLLASVLMFTVLFSTGSENSTYIIAVVGVAIWYTAAPWKRSKWDIALMVYVFIFCTMAHSDLVPRFVREEYMKLYGLKALPVVIVWLKLCYEMYVKDYAARNGEIGNAQK